MGRDGGSGKQKINVKERGQKFVKYCLLGLDSITQRPIAKLTHVPGLLLGTMHGALRSLVRGRVKI